MVRSLADRTFQLRSRTRQLGRLKPWANLAERVAGPLDRRGGGLDHEREAGRLLRLLHDAAAAARGEGADEGDKARADHDRRARCH